MTTQNNPAEQTPPPPSGQQWTIRHGAWEACVVEVGGSLRTLTRDGRPVVFGYPTAAKADAARGHVLAPLPNRIRDGKYRFEGQGFQLPLTEPARRNASHGLTHWQSWSLEERSDDQLTVSTTVHPQPGWDWTLRFEVTYSLDSEGLTVTPRAENLSASSCPFGWGMHPYLTADENLVDELTVTAPVGMELVTDDQLIPVSTRSADTRLVSGLALSGVQLDTCFTALVPDPDGFWRVRLAPTGGQGPTTTLWADANFPYVQLFTGDSLPEARRRRTGVAVEPMTCPANAFNSGDGLLVLEPGQTWSGSFGITQ